MIGEQPDAVNAPGVTAPVERPAPSRRKGHLALHRFICDVGNSAIRPKGAVMFEELNEELLDLSAGVRGVGNAVYAASQDDPGSCALCCSFVLCCCCELCW